MEARQISENKGNDEAYKYVYSIIESCNAVVFEWSLDQKNATKFVTENIRIFGFTPKDFYDGEHADYWNFVYHEDRESVKERVYKARENKMNSFSHNYRVVAKDKSIRWVREEMNLIKDIYGKLSTERGVIVDITDVILLEKELEEKENRYRRLFENAPMMILSIDDHGNILEANRQVYRETDLKSIYEYDANIVDVFGAGVLERIRGNIEGEFIEVEILCNKETVKYMQMYVNEFLNKGSRNYELIARDVTNERIENERIKYLSFHDKKTDVFNRTYFNEILDLLNDQKDTVFSVVVGDLNGLKDINSIYGYKVGDEMLLCVAKLIQSIVPEEAIVARIGGDEFGIILPGFGQQESKILCKLIREKCKAVDHLIVKPSIALGYSTKSEDDMTSTHLIQVADKRMNKNKLTVSHGESSGVIHYLEASLREKTYETEEHAHRLQTLSRKLGERLNFSDSMLDDLSTSSLMHDIGKVGIPDSILVKAGKLTENEWGVMKTHSEIGYKILNTSLRTAEIAKMILYHHERWDGSGYPEGLRCDEIPIISRIIAIVDSYDVMVNDRPYKKAMTRKDAIGELKRCAGSQFDPALVTIFINILNKEDETM